MLLILRVIADMLWEWKWISAALGMAAISLALVLLVTKGKNVINAPALLIALCTAILTYSLFIQLSPNSLIAYGKLVSAFAVFIIGQNYRSERIDLPDINGYISAALLVALSILAFTGRGYQIWGGALTFSGPYYYKTDLALAAAIALIFVLGTNKIGIAMKTALTACAIYLVVAANSRIFIPIIIVLPFILLMLSKRLPVRDWKILLPIAMGMSAIGAMVSLSYFANTGQLALDMNDGLFSEANTQGRSRIWETLIEAYLKGDTLELLLGRGLLADQEILQYNDFSDANFNSHNTYIFLLLSQGIIGLLIYLALFAYILARGWKNRQFNTTQHQFFFWSFTLVFAITGLTQSVILYQQLSWMFFFYAGKLSLRRNAASPRTIGTISARQSIIPK